jgi:hypothetical protein
MGAEICRDPDAHIDRADAAAGTPSAGAAETRRKPSYNDDWPRDEHGNALVTFTNFHTNSSVTLPCHIGFRDDETGIRLPVCPCPPKLPGWIIEIISGMTPNAFRERAAHLPGRDTSEYGRSYLTVPFFRDFYFIANHSACARETRASRKWKIRKQHRRAGCIDPQCRKQHRT